MLDERTAPVEHLKRYVMKTQPKIGFHVAKVVLKNTVWFVVEFVLRTHECIPAQ
jgi:hypothetical protein